MNNSRSLNQSGAMISLIPRRRIGTERCLIMFLNLIVLRLSKGGFQVGVLLLIRMFSQFLADLDPVELKVTILRTNSHRCDSSDNEAIEGTCINITTGLESWYA